MPIAGHALWAEVGGGHYLHDPRGVHWLAQKCALCDHGYGSDSIYVMPYMLASGDSPDSTILCIFGMLGVNGAFRRNCGQNLHETSFSLCRVFLFSRNSSFRWWGQVLWHLWVGRARHPGPSTCRLAIEFFNVGRWLTHGDLVLETQVDFIAVVEHRLIPARVRSEWARLRNEGLPAIWAPACQESSHVGNAGVGVISMRGAPLVLPTFCHCAVKEFL